MNGSKMKIKTEIKPVQIKLAKEVKEIVIGMMMDEELKAHPTVFVKQLIKEIYGHEVNLGKLIDLIETSPLPYDGDEIKDGK